MHLQLPAGHLEMSQEQSARAVRGLVAAATVRRAARMVNAFILNDLVVVAEARNGGLKLWSEAGAGAE